MSRDIGKHIFFLQPGYAHYRERLFSILSKKHNIEFVFDRSCNAYPGDVVPSDFPLTYLDKKYGNAYIGLLFCLLKNRPNIVISSNWDSYRSIVSYIYAILFKKRFILWIEQWKRPSKSNNLIKRFRRFLIHLISIILVRNCDALIATGTASKQYALHLGKDPSGLFTSIQCANDLSAERSMKSSSSKSLEGKITFLYLSRIIPYKGLDILIRAFSMLRSKRNNIQLVIAGDGSFRQYCEDLSSSLGTPDIIFLGPVNPRLAGKTYERADVFVLPSYFRDNQYEAWGLVVNEAMSMSLPVISTDAVGAAYDLIIEGHNGFIVKNNNVIDLCEAMERIIELDVSQMG